MHSRIGWRGVAPGEATGRTPGSAGPGRMGPLRGARRVGVAIHGTAGGQRSDGTAERQTRIVWDCPQRATRVREQGHRNTGTSKVAKDTSRAICMRCSSLTSRRQPRAQPALADTAPALAGDYKAPPDPFQTMIHWAMIDKIEPHADRAETQPLARPHSGRRANNTLNASDVF
jgi:hypothetical protein